MQRFTLHPMLAKDTIAIAELPLCSLLMSNDKQYPWFILVPRVHDIQDIYQLDSAQQQQFLVESSQLSELLMQVFTGDKMNVAALGNICPQLHVHHIVRYKTDASWPAPVWGKYPSVAYSEKEISEMKNKMLPAITSIF